MENILPLQNYSTWDHIQTFIDGLETENTKKNYKRSIDNFIEWIIRIKFKDIKPELLQPKHFNSLSYLDMKKFRQSLRRKHSANTVNLNMYAIYAMLGDLQRIKVNDEYIYNYRLDSLKMKPLKVTDKKEYGYLEWEEMDEWIDYLKSLPEKQLPKIKVATFHLARLTGMRKEGLVQLEWKDLIKEDGVWTLKHTLKGKQRKFSLKDEDAEMLLELKETSDPNERILKISTKTIERTLDKIKEVFEIPEERNIVFHSIRGLSIYESYLASNDILISQAHAGHSRIETTYGYIKERESIQKNPTLYMGKELNNECMNGLGRDDWNRLFGELSRSAKYEIINKAKELGLLDK